MIIYNKYINMIIKYIVVHGGHDNQIYSESVRYIIDDSSSHEQIYYIEYNNNYL